MAPRVVPPPACAGIGGKPDGRAGNAQPRSASGHQATYSKYQPSTPVTILDYLGVAWDGTDGRPVLPRVSPDGAR